MLPVIILMRITVMLVRPTLNRAQQQTVCTAQLDESWPTAAGVYLLHSDMGNSEVGLYILGHVELSTQRAKCIDQAMRTGDLWKGTMPKSALGT